VRLFNLPEQTSAWQPKLQHWAGLIASGRADDFKETALLPDFLTDIFCGLLGYTGPAESPDTFTFSRERHGRGWPARVIRSEPIPGAFVPAPAPGV